MEPARLAIEWTPLSRLTNNPSNPRLNDEAVPHVAASLRRFGWQQPLVAKRTGEVIAGNTRLKAARSLGMTEAPVVWFDGSELDAVAYSIADNKTHEFAQWDDAALAKLLTELRNEDSLDGVGFDPSEIDELIAELDAAAGREVDDPGEQPVPEQAVTRIGDLWLLGDHRLLCGDSTRPEDIARVLGGRKATLLSTDPPYCVDYTGNDRPIHDGKSSGKDWSHVYREVDIADLGQFLDGVLTACLPQVEDAAPVYMWHAHVQQPTIAATFERHGLLLHQVLVWVKPCATFGHGYYRWKHEPCAFGWKRGHKPTHGLGQLETVWEADWDGKARIATFHPCLHPEALVLTETGYRPIQSMRVGDRVYAADGAFHAVTDVSSHRYESDALVKIVAKGGNTPTLASDNHPFLIWRPERAKRRVVGGSVRWVRADELRQGDYTMTPVLTADDADPFPEKDEDFWFLFGLYLAQGSLQRAGHGPNNYPSFALNKKRQDLVRRIRRRWDSIGEYDPSDYGSPSQGVTLMAFDAEAGAVFEELGGRHAHAKRISPAVFRLPYAKRLAVLQGWLNGDGCQVQGRAYWQGKTTSPDLAAQLALLGESVGFKANHFRFDPPEQLGGIAGRQFKSQRPEHHLYFYERDTSGRANSRITHLEHEGRTFTLRYVKSVERVPYVGDVWNLSVADCPTFQTAVGMSHNTSKPTRLFEIPIEQHTRPGAVLLEPFNGSGSQLIAAEKLRRRCCAVELAPAFVDGTIARFEKATGTKAVLDGSGRTFEEVARERKGGA